MDDEVCWCAKLSQSLLTPGLGPRSASSSTYFSSISYIDMSGIEILDIVLLEDVEIALTGLQWPRAPRCHAENDFHPGHGRLAIQQMSKEEVLRFSESSEDSNT